MHLAIEPLTREAFAPFGDVIELEGSRHFTINQGTTERYHDLASIDVTEGGGRTAFNIFRGQPRQFPLKIELVERHPLGSQAFMPLNGRPYLVVVAESDAKGDPQGLRAFRAEGLQGVNYARNVWHHPLIALENVSDFVVIDREGAGDNCEERPLRGEEVWLELS